MSLVPSPLRASRIRAALRNSRFARDLRVLGLVTSTSDLVLRLAEDGAEDGLVIVADGQTRGRGRRGGAWASPSRAGLYLSLLLRPVAPDPAGLTAAVAVAAAEAASTFGVPARIKWPNDLLVLGRKCGGALVDCVQLGTSHIAVVGLGVNVLPDPVVLAQPGTAPPGSLLAEGRDPVPREALCAAILLGLEEALETLAAGKEDLGRRYRELDGLAGRRVTVSDGRATHAGTWIRSDPWDGVVIRKDDGQELALRAATSRVESFA